MLNNDPAKLILLLNTAITTFPIRIDQVAITLLHLNWSIEFAAIVDFS
jgi:hypothetical protein